MINTINLQQILLEKLEQHQLASFYILKATSKDSEERKKFLKNWIMSFLEKSFKILNSTQPFSMENIHPDIFFLQSSPSQKNYQQKDFEGFFHFLSLKPFQLKHRFVVIEDIHLISESLNNKLLKSLEAPSERMTIFFLHHLESQLLSTIQSRAITLKINDDQQIHHRGMNRLFSEHEQSLWYQQYIEESPALFQNNKEFFIELQQLLTPSSEWKIYFTGFFEKLKKDKDYQVCFLQISLDWERNRIRLYKQKEQFLNELQWFHQAQIYHNMAGERFYALLLEFCSNCAMGIDKKI